MRRNGVRITGRTLLLGALLVGGVTGTALAGVSVGVNVNLGPPPIVVSAPPEVVLVPNTDVYFVPGVEFDVFFFNGYWWSPRGDRWFRARAYDGPWRVVQRRFVPRAVFGVPHDYRSLYVRERHIPYGEWRGRHFREERREMKEERHERREEFRERGERGEHGEHGHGHER
jgi:hypothetical protein